MKKKFPTYLHETAIQYEKIYISAGQRGLQALLSPQDLIRITEALIVDLITI